MKICIDPGHGGSDPGAVGPAGTKEKEVTRLIGLALQDRLIAMGHQVELTRYVDLFVPLAVRVNIANHYPADLFISLHCNAAAKREITGIEVYTVKGTGESRTWAKRIHEGLLKRFPDHKDFAGPGPSEANFYVLRHTDMPAVLIEAEFISNPDQELFLAGHFKEIAAAIAGAIGNAAPEVTA